MAGTRRPGFSGFEKAEIWRGWKSGETFNGIGRMLDRAGPHVRSLVAANGGFVPPPRKVPKLGRTSTRPSCSSSSKSRPAASQNILDRGRCNSNAPELVSPTHTPHRTVRFTFIRCSRAFLRASASFLGTSSPMPKNTSLGVCPWNAECGMTSLWAFT